MNQPEIQKPFAGNMNNDESADIKKIVFKVLSNWHWIVLSVVITLGFAYAYVRYTAPVYEVKTTMLFEEEYGNSSPLMGGSSAVGDVFQGLGGMGSMQNIYNQVEILKSSPVVAKTLEKLDFEVSYFTIGRIATSESYRSTPFQVIWNQDHPQVVETDFNLTITPDGKMIVSAEGEKCAVYSYTEDKIIKEIPEFKFTKQVDPVL